MDPTSNGLALTGQIPLTITGDNIPGTNGLSQEKERDFNLTVQMPADMKCIGGKPAVQSRTDWQNIQLTNQIGSTGNICTVRCRNNAQAGPFGKRNDCSSCTTIYSRILFSNSQLNINRRLHPRPAGRHHPKPELARKYRGLQNTARRLVPSRPEYEGLPGRCTGRSERRVHRGAASRRGG